MGQLNEQMLMTASSWWPCSWGKTGRTRMEGQRSRRAPTLASADTHFSDGKTEAPSVRRYLRSVTAGQTFYFGESEVSVNQTPW